MSRLSRVLWVAGLVVFALACNFVTQPIRDAQQAVNTVQAVASTMPLETIQALATSIATSLPVETLEALPSAFPEISNTFNPQGEPVSEWNGIPIMTEATAGQEFDTATYSFKGDMTVKDVQDFYSAQLKDLGWESTLNLPIEGESGLLVFQKEGKFLTITIATVEGSTVAVLTLGG